MPTIVFSNPKTAEAYEALTEYDQWLEIPPDKKNDCNCHAYAGQLSAMTPCAADRYVKFGGNLIRRKELGVTSQLLEVKPVVTKVPADPKQKQESPKN